MKRICILLTLAIIAFFSCSAPREDPLLVELDGVLARSEAYEEYFLQRMDVLKQLRSGNDSQGYDINLRIAKEYMTYSLDSTLRYLALGRRIAEAERDPYKIEETDLLRVRAYAKGGFHSDALDVFSQYDSLSIPEGLEALYYSTGTDLYGELAVYSDNSDYWQLQSRCRRALLPLTDEGTYEGLNYRRQAAESSRNDSLARDYARRMLDMSPVNSHNYAEAAFFYSTYLEDEKEETQWLIRSAISDVMSATRDYASLNELAVRLYRSGDIERAFRYAGDHCMRDAIAYGGKLRPWQVAQFFPDIEKAYADRIDHSQRRMTIMVIVAAVLLVLLAMLLVLIARRQRTLRRVRGELERSKASVEKRNADLENVNAALQESGRVRQEYIALFLESLSEHIDSDRKYKNHVLRYLRRGNDKYLVEEIEALPPIDDDIQAFYRMFDKTFCNLYPDFVEQFNALLADGESILPKGDDLLTPELRVFALIKLGISDSSRIASLLHYSANTIYNYRAKVKNKARVDRATFEQAVMAIE